MIELSKEYFAELFGRIELPCSYLIYVTNTIIYEYEEVKRNLTYLCVFDSVCFFGASFFFFIFCSYLQKINNGSFFVILNASSAFGHSV